MATPHREPPLPGETIVATTGSEQRILQELDLLTKHTTALLEAVVTQTRLTDALLDRMTSARTLTASWQRFLSDNVARAPAGPMADP
ncbi:hypothetical protein H696_04503 [Fonticula alba]|uniref:Uncharacterized protein n=1 Tax=Fonticula alba TaxID=691883 RepID=A0A058Z585_FONAL|nr:hypothetical protein H696_04503 [Fonticula alba]KCV69088.1 hypothetical protein H696_04503 [Fonticula alba]|eukprot:XP_009496659.1 hypothetical protein H696_04503 [Fonticula alba]